MRVILRLLAICALQAFLVVNPGIASDYQSAPLTKAQLAQQQLKKRLGKLGGQAQDMEQLQEAINLEEARNPQTSKRIEKRQKAKELQETAETFSDVQDKLVRAGNTTLSVAGSTGIPQIQGAVSAGAVVLQAVNYLGKATSTILMAVGRYQERSQDFISVNEILINEIINSLNKLKKLKESLGIKSLIPPKEQKEPTSQLKKLGSAIKGAGKKVSESIGSAKDTILEKTDIFTNMKADKLAELQKNQEVYKKEQADYEDKMRLLQIKLLQDSVKKIDKLINIHDTAILLSNGTTQKRSGTLTLIEMDVNNFKAALSNLMTGRNKKGADKKQIDQEIISYQQKITSLLEDQKYYTNYHTNYPQNTPEKLQQDRQNLLAKMNELEPLTKLGLAHSLSKKGIDADKVFTKAGMMELYEKVYSLQKALCSLPNQISAIQEMCKGQK